MSAPTRRHVVGSVADLPPGSRRIVSVDGREIGVFHVDGRFFAMRNVCPHRGAPLCLGRVRGTMRSSAPQQYDYDESRLVVRCPWHGYEFEIEEGRALYDPSELRVRVYPVAIEDGAVVLYV